MNARCPRIAVVGSLNVDHTLRVPRIPLPGETLVASAALTWLGGKGANQAVAAARAGGEVTLIGCIGMDDHGTRYIAHLESEGIRTEAIRRSEIPTGSAFIAVDERGENTILVHPGANHSLTPADIAKQACWIEQADALLIQLECPLAAVRRAAEIARSAGVRVLLNPSPLREDFRPGEIPVDVLIVNEHEAAVLLTQSADAASRDVERTLRLANSSMLVITQGAKATLLLDAGGGHHELPPPSVAAVDTVGAGDSFAGAFAVALASGMDSGEAVRFANVAGALATLKPGAQAAIPTRMEILTFLASQAG